MRLISLATGGEHGDYDFVSYVAKDKDTGKRECQVFDCGTLSDDVLQDLGHAFTLAQELAQKSGGAGYFDVAPEAVYAGLEEAVKPAPGAESLYHEVGAVPGVGNPMYGQNDVSLASSMVTCWINPSS